jgi:hypothetical protein
MEYLGRLCAAAELFFNRNSLMFLFVTFDAQGKYAVHI